MVPFHPVEAAKSRKRRDLGISSEALSDSHCRYPATSREGIEGYPFAEKQLPRLAADDGDFCLAIGRYDRSLGHEPFDPAYQPDALDLGAERLTRTRHIA